MNRIPNGGIMYVVGNIIQQGLRKSDDRFIRCRIPVATKQIYLISDTLVDDLPQGGRF
jgi:hypothetical protein